MHSGAIVPFCIFHSRTHNSTRPHILFNQCALAWIAACMARIRKRARNWQVDGCTVDSISLTAIVVCCERDAYARQGKRAQAQDASEAMPE